MLLNVSPSPLVSVAETDQLLRDLASRYGCPVDRIRRAAIVAFADSSPEDQRASLARVTGWMGRRRPDGSDEPAEVYWRRVILDALPAGPPGISRAQLNAAI